ncbi:hypothetical protein SAMN04487783_1109 [Agrococcus baldri]|jgi:hypothetical protein|uniref:Uncharacterized protein n=1 Tax=Agrococcus baldri TaxID=153730 RepID=A0AA94KZ85_9MICO|nr:MULTISPECIES: hypothetical protein [Agrococcus]SFS08499.1 hypothetical protein SAMN04487783_1109 [Agrococcus baldri]
MSIDWVPDYGELLKRGLSIPLEGSENDAVDAVLAQLNAGGAVPPESEVRQLVQDARKGAKRHD